MALYSDRHGIFQRSPKEPESLEEQLRGRRDPTQFGRALQELGIELILAYTPQAKGRVERLFGSPGPVGLRDAVGWRHYRTTGQQHSGRLLPDFNRRFGVCAAYKVRPIVNYRQTCRWIVCFASSTCVLWPTTIPCGSTPLHSNSYPTAHRASYARATVEVQERLDGSLVAVHAGKTIGSQPAPSSTLSRSERAMAEGPQVQSTPRVQSMLLLTLLGSQQGQKTGFGAASRWKTKRSNKPGPDHPWRRKLLT